MLGHNCQGWEVWKNTQEAVQNLVVGKEGWSGVVSRHGGNGFHNQRENTPGLLSRHAWGTPVVLSQAAKVRFFPSPRHRLSFSQAGQANSYKVFSAGGR